jgi:hypothetical protein
MKMKTQTPEPMQHSKGGPKRKVYSHECIYQKDRKISNQWPNTTAETPRKRRISKYQNKQKERNN